jgi:hypothetical protein
LLSPFALPNSHLLGSTTIPSPASRAEQIARESGYKLRRPQSHLSWSITGLSA